MCHYAECHHRQCDGTFFSKHKQPFVFEGKFHSINYFNWILFFQWNTISLFTWINFICCTFLITGINGLLKTLAAQGKFWTNLPFSAIFCRWQKWRLDLNHRHKRIHCPGPPALFWLRNYVASHFLPVAPQSDVKQTFYCTVYNITLKSSCEAQRASKNLKKL